MVSGTSFTGIDTSVLLSYYSAQLQTATARTVAAVSGASTQTQTQSANSATANDAPPWENLNPPAQQARDAQVLGLTNFIDTTNVPAIANGTGGQLEQDNQKLFSLYTAVNNLSYLAGMSTRTGVTAGQQAGYNTRFQQGLQQVQNFISTESFNNLTLQAGQTQSSVTSTASVPLPPFTYQGGTVTADANITNPVPNVSASDSFTIAVKKGNATSNVNIDLSQVQGGLTLDNIVKYVNSQLSAAGFTSKLQRVVTQGSIDDPTKASYGIAIDQAAGEALTFSSAAATPALYLAGSSGSALATSTTTVTKTTTTAADQQGRLIKLTGLSAGAPVASFNQSLTPSTGNSTTNATATDSNGNVYTVGTASGNFGNELNQGTQDVVLTKYDSAGNLQWSKLLGSAGSANAYSLAVDSSNNIVVAGSTTANLSPAGIANGNADTFVAKYDADGNQTWVQQIPTLNANSANSVSVDASGNIYLGGQVNGVLAKGQTSAGGQDGYIAKLNASGTVQYEQQLGTSGSDSVAATAVGSDGSLYVASVQNGEAILTKYANGDATTAPVWTQDLGALGNGGSLGGLAVSGGNVYLSGTSSNGNLTSGGQASVVGSASGGLDAFVAGFTDNGSSATANTISYVGTSGTDSAGSVTVDASGHVYLTGTTTGTFAGQNRNAQGTQNAFVSQLNANGTVNWTQQYGGASGTSTGASVAIDTSGSSVLDALGLPRGKLDINQSVDLTSATTLRAGDSFQIQINRNGATSTQTISIDAGETLDSLAAKISGAMVFSGSAKVAYGSGGEGLTISVNQGVSAQLIAGPSGLDALGRLGIAAGTISNGASTTTSSTASGSTTKQTFGLGMTGVAMDISTSTGAAAAKAVLLNMQNAISNAYRTINTPAAAPAGPGNTAGTASAYTTAQVANYGLALTLISAGNSTSVTG